MNYKLMLIDADGTLLNDEHKISLENKTAIEYAIEKGVKIVLCSGRSYLNLIDFVKELNIYDEEVIVVSFNGGIILKGNKEEVLKINSLSNQTAMNTLKHLRVHGGDFILYSSPTTINAESNSQLIKEYYGNSKLRLNVMKSFEEELKADVPKIMAVGSREHLESLHDFMLDKLEDDINMFFSAERLLEFTEKYATKGEALNYLADYFSISKEEIISIGDNGNDYSMIENAGMGVAMKNGTEAIKKIANYVTKKTNNESAVAEVIYKFVK